jgi:hypothetical protein
MIAAAAVCVPAYPAYFPGFLSGHGNIGLPFCLPFLPEASDSLQYAEEAAAPHLTSKALSHKNLPVSYPASYYLFRKLTIF